MEGYPCLLSSGAPDSPVHHRTGPVDGPVLDLLPNLAYPTVAPLGWLVHRTLSGAHRTVRCTSRPLEQSMCRAKIAQATVGSPDSPVHHRTVWWIIATSSLCFSRGRRVRRGWFTGQSGAPPDGPVIFSRTSSSSPESGDFTRTSLAHRTLSGAPPDSLVCQAELRIGCIEPSFSLFLSSSLVTVYSTWITMLVHKTIYQV
jgi:hypothetical protein